MHADKWRVQDLAGNTVREVPIDVASARLRHQVAVSNDGKFLAMCPFDFSGETLHKVILYDISTNKQVGAVRFDDHAPHRLKFTPDDKQIALIYQNGTFELHRLPNR